MAIKMTDTKYYSEIADAIRSKADTSQTYKPTEMAQAIEDIPAGDTLSDAAAGKLAGEVVIDYGDRVSNAPYTSIIIRAGILNGSPTSESANDGITKISIVCAAGAVENKSLLSVQGSGSVYSCALEEFDFGNLEATRLNTADGGNGATLSNLKKITANSLKARTDTWNYFFCGADIESLRLPSMVQLLGSCFHACRKLKVADLGRSDLSATGYQSTIANGFMSCDVLNALVLRSPFVYNLSQAFRDNPISNGTGYIYVPRALVSQYQAATNWTAYASQFRAIEDYTVDGTIDGEFVNPIS